MSPFWLGFNSTIILIGGWKFVKDKFAEESFAYDSGIHGVSCALCGNWEEDQTLPDSSGMRYCEGCDTVLCIDCDPRKMRIVIEPNGDATHYCDACELEDYWAEESFAANNPPSYRGLLLKPANHVGRGRICDAKGCRKVMKHWRRSWGIPYYFCDEHEAHIDATYNAEDHGENVRNELAGSDIIPGFTGRNDPFKDWASMQKGYQGMRMMNNSDDFDAETKKVRRHRLDRFTKSKKAGRSYYDSRGRRFAIKNLFGSEWHTFAPCETEGCDGDIQYRDVYYCSDCGQDDVEILIGDTCPDCGVVATDTATYAIFYCSDCDEDYTDQYNAEDGASMIIHSIRDIDPECLFCEETEAEMVEVELDGYVELICEHCADPNNWTAEQVNKKKIRTLSGKPLKLRKLAKDKDLKPEDAIERLEISAETFDAQVYRGRKPFTELGYAERAVLQHKMLEAAEIEQAIINLEAAVRMGLISEEEVMKSLVERFGA